MSNVKKSFIFSGGIVTKGTSAIALIISCMLFICSLTAFTVALTASVADPELSAVRQIYALGESEITLKPAVITYDSIHGYTYSSSDTSIESYGGFTERQLAALDEYADGNLVFGQDYISVSFDLSGDYGKDKALFKQLKHTAETESGYEYQATVEVVGYGTYVTWNDVHSGAVLTNYEAVLVFIASALGAVAAVVLLNVHCKKALNKLNGTASYRTVLLQSLALAIVIVIAAICLSNAVFLVINACIGIPRALVPEIIPMLVCLALGIVLFVPVPLLKLRRIKKDCAAV